MCWCCFQTASQVLTKCSCGEHSLPVSSGSRKTCTSGNLNVPGGDEGEDNCLSMIQVAFDLQKDSPTSNICIESAFKFKKLLTAIHRVDKKTSPILSHFEVAMRNSAHQEALVLSKVPVPPEQQHV